MSQPPINVPFPSGSGGGLPEGQFAVEHAFLQVNADELTDNDTAQTFTATEPFPANARLVQSWIVREAMEGTSEVAPAFVQGAAGPTFVLAGGQTFVASVNSSEQTVTFSNGTYGYFQPSNDEPYNMNTGDVSWFMRLNNGTEETINFQASDFAVPGAATKEEVCARLNAHFGVRATAAPTGNKWRLTSSMIGIRSYAESTGGFVPWAFDFGANAGTGTSVDVTATTLAEVKNALEYRWGSNGLLVDITGGDLAVRTVGSGANMNITVQEHTAAALGFEVGSADGTDATTAVFDAGYGAGAEADKLADGMNALTTGDGAGTGTNARPSDAVSLGGKSLRITITSNYNVSELAAGGGAVAVHVLYAVIE